MRERTSFLLGAIQHAKDLEDVALFAIRAKRISRSIEAEDELPTHVSIHSPDRPENICLPRGRRVVTITRPSHRGVVAKRIHRGQAALSLQSARFLGGAERMARVRTIATPCRLRSLIMR